VEAIGNDGEHSMMERSWQAVYGRILFSTDVAVVMLSAAIAHTAWFGVRLEMVNIPDNSAFRGLDVPYVVAAVVLALAWIAVLQLVPTRSPRVIGIGNEEYRLVVAASLRLFAVCAVVAFLVKVDIGRGFVVTFFFLGVVGLIADRWLWRQWLVAQRRRGSFSHRTIVVGSPESIGHIAHQFGTRFPFAGYTLVGACVQGGSDELPESVDGVRVLGDGYSVVSVARHHQADLVLVSSADQFTPATVRRISWELEDTDIDLAVSPALLDVVGPRVHTRSVAGMPILHVDIPRYEGGRAFGKLILDRSMAFLALVALSPFLIAIAIVVRSSSPGPILFRQERVGKDGVTFEMLKFRSMASDAESRVAELAERNESSGGVLFKIRDDPRVTRVGRFLRRHSLDELPQFINVLRGDMSVVGPRPPLPSEVEQYESHVMRRFLVRPGLTGPWQVSGRSDLSWEESVRLDLYYVENWSVVGDLFYVARTIRVMFGGHGGY
jgi:exopolysaccharide biosynthesis polyprenyl glycosylphosphotransferase